MAPFWICVIRNRECIKNTKKILRITGAVMLLLGAEAGRSWATALPLAGERSFDPSHGMAQIAAQNSEAGTCKPFNDQHRVSDILLPDGTENYAIIGQSISLYPEEQATQTLAHRDQAFRDEIDAIVAPYLGTRVTAADLQAIQDAVSLLYLKGGYITSWADCVQVDGQGKLIINVTEGFIQDFSIGWNSGSGTVYVPIEPYLDRDLGVDRDAAIAANWANSRLKCNTCSNPLAAMDRSLDPREVL